jgi:hypothetical protein
MRSNALAEPTKFIARIQRQELRLDATITITDDCVYSGLWWSNGKKS